MALQIENVFDILCIKHPTPDFFTLMDQSSGHGRRMEGGLNAGEMSVRFCASQLKMRKIIVNKLGTYPSQMKVGNIHLLTSTHGGVASDASTFPMSKGRA